MLSGGAILTVVVKNGCFKASLTVILFSGSTTKHFLMRSLGSSAIELIQNYFLLDLENSKWSLTRYISPFRRCKTIFSFHNISKHNHLLSMPKWRTPHQQSEHYHTTGPSVDKIIVKITFESMSYYWLPYISTSFE